MPKLKLTPIATAAAIALAGSTGYCAFTTGMPAPPAPAPASAPAVRLLPEAIIPYPLEAVVPPLTDE